MSPFDIMGLLFLGLLFIFCSLLLIGLALVILHEATKGSSSRVLQRWFEDRFSKGDYYR